MRSRFKGGGNITMDAGESRRNHMIEGGLAPYAASPLTPALRVRHGRLHAMELHLGKGLGWLAKRGIGTTAGTGLLKRSEIGRVCRLRRHCSLLGR
jgi:hypothetical protein